MTRRIHAPLLSLLACALAACGSSPDAAAPAPESERALPRAEVVRSGMCGVTERSVRVARTDEELEALWADVYAFQRPAPPVPEVDLASSMVVAVFMGARPSGGYAIEIVDVSARAATADENAEVLVRVRETLPADGDPVTMATTSPFHVVVVERADGAARLEAE